MNNFQKPKRLLLQPTSLAPGLYPDEDCFVVVSFNGNSYQVIWDEEPQEEDIIFEDVYVKDISYAFYETDGINVEYVVVNEEKD